MVPGLIIILLFIGYSILIRYYWLQWRSIPRYSDAGNTASTKFSIIIPARNEEKNIGKLLNALQAQDYPQGLVEIIVVDDHSTDRTAEVVAQFQNVKLLKLTDDGTLNSYKKKAIEKGISAAVHEWIITTDADCVPPAAWLRTLALFSQQTNAGLIVAPVVFECNNQLIEIFQAMDFMVLQGITGAAVHAKKHSMCNGANLAYEKKLFNEVNGFAGIDHIASGDDMLLMHKIASKYPERIHYIKSKDATVSTLPMPTWKEFFNQRIRWASKAAWYDDKRIIWVLVLVYLFNLSFPVLLIAGFWNPAAWLFAMVLWLLKTVVEMPFYYSVAVFFQKTWSVKYFFFFQPLHIFYTILSGLLGQFGKYEWKGRKVN